MKLEDRAAVAALGVYLIGDGQESWRDKEHALEQIEAQVKKMMEDLHKPEGE